jgi:hypothetical protein
MSRKRLVFLGAALGVASVIALWGFLSYAPSDDARYRELVRAHRLSANLARYQFSPMYQRITQVMKMDPARHYSEKAERLESALYRSGYLVSLTVCIPDLQGRSSQVRTQLMGIMKRHPELVWSWNLSSDDYVRTLCRPDLVAFIQSEFCSTNLIPYSALQRLAGSREDVACRLPVGSTVNLDACWKWLRESRAGGWMVGVIYESDRPGHQVIVATRKKAEAKVPPRVLN